MGNSFNLETITLSHWPSCYDCLVSSDDEIACASGGDVHILSVNTQDPQPQNPWHVNTLKVNQFSESEWPIQKLAPLHLFSIGEEQSESLVVALSWSPRGLGLHKRAVLAVLTSNLVLSLWETDGSLGKFRRTCIVNAALATGSQGQYVSETIRRAHRIRSFAWNPVLKDKSLPRHGLFHLTVADDDAKIHVLRLTKPPTASFGNFTIQHTASFLVSEVHTTVPQHQTMSTLQRELFRESAISRITVSDWQQKSAEESTSGAMIQVSRLDIFKGLMRSYAYLSASVSDGDVEFILSKPSIENIPCLRIPDQDGSRFRQQQGYELDRLDAEDEQIDLEQCFNHALKPLIKSFDEVNRLFGNFKVQFWGLCPAFQTSSMAACVTIHPTDMVEHTQPSFEKCNIIFARSLLGSQNVNKGDASPPAVQTRILHYAISQLQHLPETIDEFDTRLLAVVRALAHCSSDTQVDTGSVEVAWLLHQPHNPSNHPGTTELSSESRAVEICEICSAGIPFSSDTSSARCTTGHQFTRCNLTFLTIQQPGISKYCSGCSKQFLDLAKLGSEQNSSLAQALFEEFDVCPYCDAKFRG